MARMKSVLPSVRGKRSAGDPSENKEIRLKQSQGWSMMKTFHLEVKENPK